MRKRRGRRILVFLLTILFLCGLVFTASGSSVVYLMSVNDTVVPGLTASNMPFYSNGELYIPYIMLTTQANLGVRAQYNSSRGQLILSGTQKSVIFDTRQNLATSGVGAPLDVHAIVRNSMAFVPVDWLCSYFSDLGYSLTRTPYGILVRLTSSAAVLSDLDFVDAADTLLQQNLLSYQNSLITPSTSTEPTSTPTATPSPSVSPSTPPPSSEPEPVVYLAFYCGSETSKTAAVLEQYQQRALFFFTVDELKLQDDLIRRLVGSGHQIGLSLTGGDAEACIEELAQGKQLLLDIARSALLIVSADALDHSGHRQLEEAGCAVWQATLNGDGLTEAGIIAKLSASESNYVQLTCGAADLTLLSDLLQTLSGEEYRLYQALAPVI